jgi:hypothetical protein
VKDESPATRKIKTGAEPHHGWIKMMRGEDILELLENAPNAFLLASLIALRARFKPGVNYMNGLDQGEAFLGDHEACGLTEQEYRTAKRQLEKWKFATFTATTKGTVAKLIGIRLFDVLNQTANERANRPVTIIQRAGND